MEIEIDTVEFTVAVHYKNSKGLARRAALGLALEKEVFEENYANKAKWNKYIGDLTKQAIEACLDRGREEYGGIEALRASSVAPGTATDATDATEEWEEQNKEYMEQKR